MAETEKKSLDDFFAKRDKKKRKEKSSRAGATSASAASANAAGGGGGSGAGGSRQADGGSGAASHTNASAASAARAAHKEEDDWKEFEQEETIDYSGLRVQSMQISEKDDEESEKREDPGDNSEEPGGGAEKSSGPWNRSSAPTQAPVAEPIETPEPVQSGMVYRPPGAREGRTRKATQGPPEIYSDTQFPSLQSTAKHVDSRRY